MKKFIALFLVAMLWPLFSHAASGGPVEGVVFDEETGKPIEGAIVVARWTAQLNQIADSSTMCYHVETTTTDAEGRYRIERWHSGHPGMLQQLVMFDREVYVRVYAEGYRMPNRFSNERIGMLEFIGTHGDRLEYLRRILVNCNQAGKSEKNLLPMLNAIYAEAVGLAESNDNYKIVNSILFSLEIIELGYEEAERRDIDRGKEYK